MLICKQKRHSGLVTQKLVFFIESEPFWQELMWTCCLCLAPCMRTQVHTHTCAHTPITAIHAPFELLPWQPVSILQRTQTQTHIHTQTQWIALQGPHTLISWERTVCAKRYISCLLRKKIYGRSHDSLHFCKAANHDVVTQLYHSMIMYGLLPLLSSKVN